MESRFQSGDPERLAVLIDGGTVSPAAPLSEGVGSIVGRYKLLQLIGEGGFGAVFMAEQEYPVRRRVALKIIKLGMDTKQVVARFEAERQALAMMDHTNIARVLDAGATEAGRPYFVMELVRGSPITEYCDKNALSTRERLELFIHVCQAVQHAHQKGIIHRDLKPTNVLVTVCDGKPVPKVIDFGIAKSLQARLTEKTLFTEFRQLIGTPEYMSPEQADSDGVDIDTRSDIYSLGVLLYELLTGTTPFDPEELRSAAYAEIQRIIREVEPPKPSGRLSTLGDGLTNVAARRKTEPGKLAQLVRGELDWIVMKAIDKDRGRRYNAAGELADDIDRHLNDEPVLARPAGSWYRLRKFSKKNRLVLRIGAVIMITLVCATVVSYSQARRALRAQTLAQEAAAREASQRKEAEAVAGVLESIFDKLDPYDENSGADLHTQLESELDKAAATLDKDFADEPLVRARLRTALGETQLGLGEIAKAEALLKSASSERRTFAKPDDPGTLRTMSDLAFVYVRAGRYADAIALCEQVRDRQMLTLGPDHHDTLENLMELAQAYGLAGHRAEQVQLLESVRDRRMKNLGADHPDTVAALAFLAEAYRQIGRNVEAIKLLERVRDQNIKDLGPDHPSTLITLNDLACAYRAAGRTVEAMNLFEQVLDRGVKKLGPDHPEMLTASYNLADSYLGAGRCAEAIEQFKKVWERQAKKLGPDHPETLRTLFELGLAYEEAGRISDAIRLFEQLRDQEHSTNVTTLQYLAVAYRRAGRTAAAITLDEQARDGMVQQLAALGKLDPALSEGHWERAQLCLRLGRFKDADEDLARLVLLGKGKAGHYFYFYRGCLLGYLGESAAYEANCKEMFDRFGASSDAAEIERTAKTCLLLPDGAGGDPKQLLALIERAPQALHDGDLGGSWIGLVKALALYRIGDFSGCLVWAEKARAPDSFTVRAFLGPTEGLLAAMAHSKLGHSEQAMAYLRQADGWAEKSLPKVGQGDLGFGEVVNWLVFQTLRREAEALMPGAAPSTTSGTR